MLTFNDIYTFVKQNGTGNNFGKACLRTETGDHSIKIIKAMGPPNNRELWVISRANQAIKVTEQHTLVALP